MVIALLYGMEQCTVLDFDGDRVKVRYQSTGWFGEQKVNEVWVNSDCIIIEII